MADLKEHICLGFPSHSYWPNWMLTRGGQQRTIRPNCALVADNSEVILMAALDGVGIALLPDWLVGPPLRARKLVQVLSDWTGRSDGGLCRTPAGPPDSRQNPRVRGHGCRPHQGRLGSADLVEATISIA